MSLKYIRQTYRVPARRGRIVSYWGEVFRIVSSRDAHLVLRNIYTPKWRIIVHPTDERLIY